MVRVVPVLDGAKTALCAHQFTVSNGFFSVLSKRGMKSKRESGARRRSHSSRSGKMRRRRSSGRETSRATVKDSVRSKRAHSSVSPRRSRHSRSRSRSRSLSRSKPRSKSRLTSKVKSKSISRSHSSRSRSRSRSSGGTSHTRRSRRREKDPSAVVTSSPSVSGINASVLDEAAIRVAALAAAQRLQSQSQARPPPPPPPPGAPLPFLAGALPPGMVPSPPATDIRPGDWFCPICAAHNFASKFQCFRCFRGTNPLLTSQQNFMHQGFAPNNAMLASMPPPM